MKSFKTLAAQGEVNIKRLAKAPSLAKWTSVEAANGQYIIGHSETGHHHVIDADGVTVYEKPGTESGMRVLLAIVEKATALEHTRGFDTHEPIQLEPGVYQFSTGREYDPYEQLARRISD